LHQKVKKRSGTTFVIIAAIIIILISQYKNIVGYLFPIKYDDAVIHYSEMYNIDPYLVFALINVESHYRPDAESNKGAKGLMQITPSTGRWIAEKMGILDFDESMLYDPIINIRMGCWYIDNIKKEFGLESSEDDIVLMLAAYNGGSGNVRKWLTNKEYSQTGTTLEQIPFTETHQYVEKVLKNYGIYKWLYPEINSTV
jgi:soluble lytic murein transglycosylase